MNQSSESWSALRQPYHDGFIGVPKSATFTLATQLTTTSKMVLGLQGYSSDEEEAVDVAVKESRFRFFNDLAKYKD